MHYDTAIRSYTSKRIEEVESADILVGIPSYNEKTIDHVIQMVTHGLSMHYKDRRCVSFVADGGSTDDTREPLIGPDTVVITLQNGVEAVDMVSRHVGGAHVAGGVAYIVAVVDRPGQVTHTTADRLVFGERDGRPSDRLQRFQEAGSRAGFVADLSLHIDVDLWVKFVRLGTWSGMTTATRSTIGVIRQHPPLMRMMDAAQDEAMAVGRARGIAFPEGLVEGTRQLVQSFPPESKSSMLGSPWIPGRCTG